MTHWIHAMSKTKWDHACMYVGTMYQISKLAKILKIQKSQIFQHNNKQKMEPNLVIIL